MELSEPFVFRFLLFCSNGDVLLIDHKVVLHAILWCYIKLLLNQLVSGKQGYSLFWAVSVSPGGMLYNIRINTNKHKS